MPDRGTDRHARRPLCFRPAPADHDWLYARARETGRPVNAILTEALTAYRDAQTGQDSDMAPASNGNGSGPHDA